MRTLSLFALLVISLTAGSSFATSENNRLVTVEEANAVVQFATEEFEAASGVEWSFTEPMPLLDGENGDSVGYVYVLFVSEESVSTISEAYNKLFDYALTYLEDVHFLPIPDNFEIPRNLDYELMDKQEKEFFEKQDSYRIILVSNRMTGPRILGVEYIDIYGIVRNFMVVDNNSVLQILSLHPRLFEFIKGEGIMSNPLGYLETTFSSSYELCSKVIRHAINKPQVDSKQIISNIGMLRLLNKAFDEDVKDTTESEFNSSDREDGHSSDDPLDFDYCINTGFDVYLENNEGSTYSFVCEDGNHTVYYYASYGYASAGKVLDNGYTNRYPMHQICSSDAGGDVDIWSFEDDVQLTDKPGDEIELNILNDYIVFNRVENGVSDIYVVRRR